jgi:hypothetical protein
MRITSEFYLKRYFGNVGGMLNGGIFRGGFHGHPRLSLHGDPFHQHALLHTLGRRSFLETLKIWRVTLSHPENAKIVRQEKYERNRGRINRGMAEF